MGKLWLHNTATRKKEAFVPLDPDHVRMYVCGPTVYDRAHLGNARSAVVFDVLARLLRHLYPRVTYVRNVTDVDDKINARAAETGRPIREITGETLGWYHEDMDALGVARPDIEPRATEYIPQMVAMIAELIAKGFAYEAEGHVLFEVRKYPEYGALSGRSIDDMIAGARVEVAPFKRDPMDFVLWKPAGDGPGWPSPWGTGRPGWHIECSAMAGDLLGETFDIHGGGIDLQFPHHENEIAQSNCAHGTRAMARVWLHNEMLQVEGKKMSKSLGNFFTVRELLDKGYPGEVIRFVLLSTHYGKPMDWTEKKAEEARATLKRWHSFVEGAGEPVVSGAVVSRLADNLNTAGAISAINESYRAGNKREVLGGACLMGMFGEGSGEWWRSVTVNTAGHGHISWGDDPDMNATANESEVTQLINQLIAARVRARNARDFARADAIRDAFKAAGVEVQDGSDGGTTWSLTTDFDATKLAGLL